MFQGQHWVIRTEEQRENAVDHARRLPLPFSAKFAPPVSPKTAKQVRYAHSLCGALAAYHKISPEDAKKDAKVEFGVIEVYYSCINGDKTARLKSFADYSKEQMEGFISGMEAHLDENNIPYTRSKEQ